MQKCIITWESVHCPDKKYCTQLLEYFGPKSIACCMQ